MTAAVPHKFGILTGDKSNTNYIEQELRIERENSNEMISNLGALSLSMTFVQIHSKVITVCSIKGALHTICIQILLFNTT